MQTTLPRDLGSRFIPFPMIPGSPALMPEPGIEAVKVSGVALLPLSQDDLIVSVASGEATEVKKSEDIAFDNETLWTQAYELVERLKQKITGFAGHFLPYSSYPLDDFIQQAYESGFKALEKCLEKGETKKYKGYFWRQYRQDCSKMAHIPSRKKFYEESIKNSIKDHSLAEEILKELSKSPLSFEAYREYSEDDAPATAVASSIPDPFQTAIWNEEALDNELKELIQQETVKKAICLMTKRERQVWEYLLGYHDGRIENIKDLEQILGLKKPRIIKLRDNALAYVKEVFAVYQKLYTREEVSKQSGYSIGTIKLMKRYGFLKAKEDYIQRVKNGSALFTEKAINKLNVRREGKIWEETLTIEEAKKKFKRQKLYTLQELSEKTGYSLSTLRSMRCYGFFKIGIEGVKVSGVALLPLSQDDLIASCASGEATGVKKYAGRSFYLFTEKAVKKLLHRRKRTPAIPARETKLPAAICERTLNFYSRSHIATRIATRAAAG